MWKEFLFVICTTSFCVLVSSQETIFHCPEKNGTKTFDITCPGDTVINITDAIYGRNKWELCMYLTNDCTEKVDLRSECCGRQQCNVTVWRIYSINCTYVTFFRLIYECVKRERSNCGFPVGLIADTSTTKKPTTEQPRQTTHKPIITPKETDAPEIQKKEEIKSAEGVLVIVVSAASVAFLLVAIIAVVFLLKRFQWQAEKQCILEFFIGMCKRQPPDGCENPDEERSQSNDNYPNGNNIQSPHQKTVNTTNNNNVSKSQNLQKQQELVLTVIDKTLESDKILQEQNLRFCTPDVIPKKPIRSKVPKSILKNDEKAIEKYAKAKTNEKNIVKVIERYVKDIPVINEKNIESETSDKVGELEIKIKRKTELVINGSDNDNISDVTTTDSSVDEQQKEEKIECEQGGETDSETHDIVTDDTMECGKVKMDKPKSKDYDSKFDYDGGVIVVDDLHLSRLRNDVSVENLYRASVERSNSTPSSQRQRNIMFYQEQITSPRRPKLLQRFGANTVSLPRVEDEEVRNYSNSFDTEEVGTTAV